MRWAPPRAAQLRYAVSGALVAAALAAGGVLYIASSPWLVWHSLSADAAPNQPIAAVFSAGLPAELVGLPAELASLPLGANHQAVEDFTSLRKRWRYGMAHRSAYAWQETIITLAIRGVPLHPAALFYTEQWFEEPTLVIATVDDTTVRLRAEAIRSAHQSTSRIVLPALPTAQALHVVLPGAVLTTLPTPLKEAWNSRLRGTLGFTATRPDIVRELSQYDQVVVSIAGDKSAIGIVGGAEAARRQWEERLTAWIVDEDRFRRPVTQAFRLPDGTLGRETVAGLPGMVWRQEAEGSCRAPLPEKPAVWVCQRSGEHMLANHPWHSDDISFPLQPRWEIAMGHTFLKALPAVSALRAAGTTTTAAVVLSTQ